MEPLVLIDVDRCVGCYMCQRACALAQCIEINESSRLAEVVRPEDCTGCKACERACPYDCILVLSDETSVSSRAKVTLSRVRRYASKGLITVDPEETVRRAAEIMTKEGIGSLVLNFKGVRIVTESDILDAWIDGRENDPVVLHSKEAITIEGSATVDEALSIMLAKKIGHLPVTERGELTGMLSIRDALRSASMTSPINTEGLLPINPKEKVGRFSFNVPILEIVTNREAYHTLKNGGLKATVVKELDRVGLISIRDLTRALADRRSLEDRIQPRWVKPISAEEPLSKALALMMEHNIRHLPVVSNADIKMIDVKEIAKQVVWVKSKVIEF